MSVRHVIPADRLAGIEPPDRGLTSAEAEARLQRHGPNAILEKPPGHVLALLRDTAADPMLWFLAVTALLYLWLGNRGDALTLALVLLPLAGMDAWLHRRTSASTEGLASRLAARARVLRDGGPVDIPALSVVPGDLALVRPSEPFPADGIVISGENLQADESSLSGEALPVAKRPVVPAPAAPGAGDLLVDAAHCVFAGTRLLTGSAAVRIVRTAGETRYGEIVRSARAASGRTPLQAAVGRLVGFATGAAALLCLVLAAVRLSQGFGWADAALSAVTLAVAALPEEFPVVLTVFLGVGVLRLARRQALVRRAASVENIGRVSCICTDKTGTITEGRLRVEHLLPAPGTDGERLLALAARASRQETGDPLDAAILAAASEAGAAAAEADGRTIATFPFTEDRRRETVLAAARDGGACAIVKGSPETVFAMCDLEGGERGRWEAQFAGLAAEGHKVIACAWRPAVPPPEGGPPAEPRDGYRIAGLVACGDPIREGVRAAVRACREAGIHTLMLTGDHPATARAVARRVGLGDGEPEILEGGDLEDRLAAEGAGLLLRVDGIARARPAQKLAVVKALRAAGAIVAVTGDGVNDVPAIQAADVGIAMGGRGTRSAREVASIVLLDDDFGSIVRAIAEGRQLFLNLRRSFLYLLAIHVPLVLTATLVPLLGYPLLYLPIHIAWLEMVIHPSAMLAFQDRPAAGPMGPPAGGRRARILSVADAVRVGMAGLLATLVVTLGSLLGLEQQGVAHARAFALVALAATSAGLVAVLDRLRGAAGRVVAAATLGGSILLVQAGPLAERLHVTPLHAPDLVLAILGGAAPALLLLAGGRRDSDRRRGGRPVVTG